MEQYFYTLLCEILGTRAACCDGEEQAGICQPWLTAG